LCRRNIFDFARIKREDLFEVVALQQRVPQRLSKTKIRGYPVGTIQPRGKFFASFLLVQERWSLKPKGFSETKKN
jgi:hypothetical protein